VGKGSRAFNQGEDYKERGAIFEMKAGRVASKGRIYKNDSLS
jgi:hypothetical protein